MKSVALAIILTAFSALWGGEATLGADTHFNYTRVDADNNSFQTTRAYFTVKQIISETLTYKFQVDVGAGAVSDYTLFLKNAKVDWKTGFGKLSLGLQGMNMFKVQENNWGYRFIEKAALDKYKYSSSADMGVGWYKSFGKISSGFMITNGNGYKKQENDQYKKLSVNMLYGPATLKKGINGGFAFSFEPQDYETTDTSSGMHKGHTTVLAGYSAWSNGILKVGFEAAVYTENTEDTSSKHIISTYLSRAINSRWECFSRMDVQSYDASTDTYFILGAVFHPEKAFYIAPNVRGMFTDGNGEYTYSVNFRLKI